MKKPSQIACILFLGMSLFSLVMSFEYPYHDKLGPGPGFFPFWISVISGVLAVGLLVQTSLSEAGEQRATKFIPERPAVLRILLILGSLICVLFLLNPLGFRLSLFLFLVFVPLGLGYRKWWFIVIFAIGGSFGVFHVFYYWLRLPLPIGAFGL